MFNYSENCKIKSSESQIALMSTIKTECSDSNSNKEENDECAICLEPQMDVQIFGCHRPHTFHRTCILQWFEIRNECPICLRAVNAQDLVYIVCSTFCIHTII